MWVWCILNKTISEKASFLRFIFNCYHHLIHTYLAEPNHNTLTFFIVFIFLTFVFNLFEDNFDKYIVISIDLFKFAGCSTILTIDQWSEDDWECRVKTDLQQESPTLPRWWLLENLLWFNLFARLFLLFFYFPSVLLSPRYYETHSVSLHGLQTVYNS